MGCKCSRSRQMLQNEYLLANIGIDREENELCEVGCTASLAAQLANHEVQLHLLRSTQRAVLEDCYTNAQNLSELQLVANSTSIYYY